MRMAGRGSRRERNIDHLPLARTLSGDRTCNRGMWPDWGSNLSGHGAMLSQLSHTCRSARWSWSEMWTWESLVCGWVYRPGMEEQIQGKNPIGKMRGSITMIKIFEKLEKQKRKGHGMATRQEENQKYAMSWEPRSGSVSRQRKLKALLCSMLLLSQVRCNLTKIIRFIYEDSNKSGIEGVVEKQPDCM